MTSLKKIRSRNRRIARVVSLVAHAMLAALILFKWLPALQEAPPASEEVAQNIIEVMVKREVETPQPPALPVSVAPITQNITPMPQKIATAPRPKQSFSKPVTASPAMLRSSVSGQAAMSYMAMVVAWLEQFKNYPSEARRQGLEGKGVLSITIGENGRVLARKLSRSTGHRVLDNAIMEMVNVADPLPKPDATVSLDIPIEFSIER